MPESAENIKEYDYYNPENWKPTHEYKPRQLWFPLSENISYWDDKFHQLMLHDHLRMQKFNEAIKESVKYFLDNRSTTDTLRVLDIGTGYGILTYWVLKTAEEYKPDAKVRVYAIEANPITSGEAYRRLDNAGFIWKHPKTEDGSNQKAMVINTSSYYLNQALFDNEFLIKQFDAELWKEYEKNKSFDTFDLIISETLGSIGDNEDTVCILDHAISEFLKPSGMVIPHTVESYLVPIHSERFDTRAKSIHKSFRDSKVNTIGKHYIPNVGSDKFIMIYDVIIPKEDYLSNPQKIAHWTFSKTASNLNDNTRREYERDFIFEINRDGVFSGFKGFFRANLVNEKKIGKQIILDIEGDSIEENQTSDCWKHLYFPVEKQFTVEKRQRINLTFTRKQKSPDNQEIFLYKWKGENLTITGAIKNAFEHEHPIIFPFTPPRRTFSSHLIENTNYTLEATHYGQSIFPETDEEFIEIVRKALINSPMALAVKSNAGIQVDEPEKKKLINHANEQRHKEITNKCIFAYKSIDNPHKIVFVSADPEKTQEEMRRESSQCFYINYSVKVKKPAVKTEISPEDLLQIEPLPDFQENSLLMKNRDDSISMALIVPDNYFQKLSKDDILDLRDVMSFLQTRIFLMILSRENQAIEVKRKVEEGILKEAASTSHELKYLASAFSGNWLVEPNSEVKRHISVKTDAVWENLDWLVIPFPQLLKSTGAFLKLWAGEDFALILKEENLTGISGWIKESWNFTINLTTASASKLLQFDTSERIQDAQTLFDEIENVLMSKIKINIDPNIDSHIFNYKRNTSIKRTWNLLTRWLINMMFNYIRHGDIDSGLEIEVRKVRKDSKEHLIEFKLKNRKWHKEIKPYRWIPKDLDLGRTLTIKSKDVEEAIEKELEAIPEWSPEEDVEEYFCAIGIKMKKFGIHELSKENERSILWQKQM